MSTQKPSAAEEEYIAREEILKRQKLAREVAERTAAAEVEARRKAHWMRCPKCGGELAEIKFRELVVDRCFHCDGTWLDAGELEKLAGQEHAPKVLRAVIDAFTTSAGRK